MKKVVAIIICLLLCAGIVGGAVAWYNKSNPDDNPVIDTPIETPDDNGGNTDNDENEQPSETPEDIPLTEPSNVATLQSSQFRLKSIPELRFNNGDESIEPAIRFTCLVDNSLIEEVRASENKKFGFIIAPIEYFDKVNTENKTCIDWMTAFNDAGMSVLVYEHEDVDSGLGVNDDSTYFLKQTIANIKNQNVVLRFVGMGYIVDRSGDTPVYTYCSQPDGETYRTTARSVIQLAGEALNANAMGERSYTVEEITKMKNYINIAVDMVNGLTEPTEDGSMPTVTFTSGNEISVATGKKQQIKFALTPEHKRMVLPARYVSMNEDIAVVNSNGVVTGLSTGSTTVKVYIAGELYNINVTVTNNA